MPTGECGEGGLSCHSYSFLLQTPKAVSPWDLRIPCSFRILTTEVPVAHGSSYLSLVYLFVVPSWAFFPESSVKKAYGWSSKAPQ